MESAIDQLRQFLEPHVLRVGKHWSMVEIPKCKYDLKSAQFQEFVRLYSQHLASIPNFAHTEAGTLEFTTFSERVPYENTWYLRFDFDLKVSAASLPTAAKTEQGLHALYTAVRDTIVPHFVHTVQEVAGSILVHKDQDSPSALKAYVTMRHSTQFVPDPLNPKYSWGFHVMLPGYVCTKESRSYIVNAVDIKIKAAWPALAAAVGPNTLEHVGADTIVDKHAYENSAQWMLYGSGKPRMLPHLLICVINANGDVEAVPEELNVCDNDASLLEIASRFATAASLFTIRRRYTPAETVKTNTFLAFEAVAEEAGVAGGEGAPRYRYPWDKPPRISTDGENYLYGPLVSAPAGPRASFAEQELDVLALLELLNEGPPIAASDTFLWSLVGVALRSVSEDLLDNWIAFSRRWPKYNKNNNDAECRRLWNSDKRLGANRQFPPGFSQPVEIMTFVMNTCAPERFSEFYSQTTSETVLQLIDSDTGGTDSTRARIFQLVYGRYIVVIDNQNAYRFDPDKHRYVHMNPDDMCAIIMDNVGKNGFARYLGSLIPKEAAALAELKRRAEEAREAEAPPAFEVAFVSAAARERGNGDMTMDEQKKEHRLKKLRKMQTDMMTLSKATNVRKVAWMNMLDKQFVEKRLDKNPDVIGFDNGVYNMLTGRFGRGVPNDCNSKTTRYNFPTEDEDVVVEMSLPVQQLLGYLEDRRYECEMKAYGTAKEEYDKRAEIALRDGDEFTEPAPEAPRPAAYKQVRCKYDVMMEEWESRRSAAIAAARQAAEVAAATAALSGNADAIAAATAAAAGTIPFNEPMPSLELKHEPYEGDRERYHIGAHLHTFLEFIWQISSSLEWCDYVLRMCTYFLRGKNEHELVHFLLGCGANGKSKLMELLEMMLGEYAYSSDSATFAESKKTAGSARPDMLRMRGSRLISVPEPNHNSPLDSSQLKMISGGDRFSARSLFSNAIIEFEISAHVVLVCNGLPPFDRDNAMQRRVAVVQFNTNMHVDEEVVAAKRRLGIKSFKTDSTVGARLKAAAPYVMRWLLRYMYPYFKLRGVSMPPALSQDSKAYLRVDDALMTFIQQYVAEASSVPTAPGADPPEPLTFFAFRTEFQRWHRDTYNTRYTGGATMLPYLDSIFGPKKPVLGANNELTGNYKWPSMTLLVTTHGGGA